MRYESWEGVDRSAHADLDTESHVTPSEQTQRFPYFIRKWHADFWSDIRDGIVRLRVKLLVMLAVFVGVTTTTSISEWLEGRYNYRSYNFPLR